MRQVFGDEDWGGLRQSHFRVISRVGERRYRTFRRVLEELALATDQ